MRRVAFACLLAGACGFDPHGSLPGDLDGAVIDAAPGDGASVDAASLDGASPDARVIDAAVPCPTGYTITTGGGRYQLHSALVSLDTAVTDCADDLAGRTHLATFESGNLDAVLSASGAGNGDEVYVGGKCTMTGDACDDQANWVWTGSLAPVATTLWDTGEPSLMLELTYAARSNGTWKLLSSAGVIARPYLCECDP